MGTLASPLVPVVRLSQTQEAGDPFTLTQWQKSLISYKATFADFVIITLHQTFCRHFFHHQAETCPGSITQTQCRFDLWTIQTVLILVRIHRQNRQNCPLVGVTKSLRIGESGRKHCGSVELLTVCIGFCGRSTTPDQSAKWHRTHLESAGRRLDYKKEREGREPRRRPLIGHIPCLVIIINF